jgi:hypothetical protein
MSSNIFDTIVPTTTSGNQLAAILNNFKDAIVSGFSGTTRPSQLQAGGYWIDTTDPTLWAYKMYTGVQDITIFTLNLNTGSSSISSADSSFEISRISADSLGPVLNLLKERIADNGQTKDGDTLGEIQFFGTRDTGTNVLTARIRALASDNTTATGQGTYLIFEGSVDEESSISEFMRLIDGKMGLGITSPEKTLHLAGSMKLEEDSDSVNGADIELKKKRISNQGQVLSGDSISKIEFNSHDNSDNNVPGVLVEVKATENHTTSGHGTSISIKNKKVGETTFTEQIFIGDKVEIKTDLEISGGLIVQGTTTTINTENLDVEDANITINKGGTQAIADSSKAGLTVEMSDATNAIIGYDSSKVSKFVIGEVGSESEIVTVDGAQTLSNKTFDSAIFTSSKADSFAYEEVEDNTQSGSNITLTGFTKPIVRLTNASLASISGITAAELPTNFGGVLTLINATGVDLVIVENNLGANSIITGADGDIDLAINASILLKYDTISDRWRIVGGSGTGGGSGASSFNWVKSTVGPISEFISGFKLESFDYESPEQELYCLLSVPKSYRPGKPIKLSNSKFFCGVTSGKVLFKTVSAILSSTYVLGSSPATYTSTNSPVTVSGVANRINSVGILDITDTVGQINGVNVQAGDKILIRLFRDSANEAGSALADAKLVIDSFEPLFS